MVTCDNADGSKTNTCEPKGSAATPRKSKKAKDPLQTSHRESQPPTMPCVTLSNYSRSCFHRSIKIVRRTPKLPIPNQIGPYTKRATISNNGSVAINFSWELRAPTACVQSLQRSVRIDLSATIGPNQSVCKQSVEKEVGINLSAAIGPNQSFCNERSKSIC